MGTEWHRQVKEKKRTVKDVVLLWMKHQMLYRTEQNSPSWSLKDMCRIYTKTENEPHHSLSGAASIVSVQALQYDHRSQIWGDRADMLPEMSHPVSVSTCESLLLCFLLCSCHIPHTSWLYPHITVNIHQQNWQFLVFHARSLPMITSLGYKTCTET